MQNKNPKTFIKTKHQSLWKILNTKQMQNNFFAIFAAPTLRKDKKTQKNITLWILHEIQKLQKQKFPSSNDFIAI